MFRTRQGLGYVASPAVRFCIALSAAALLTALAFGLVPEDLDVRTDIVGYPTYANFNINRYFWAYGFVVGLFPLLTFSIYLGLTRIFGRRGQPREPIPAPLERMEIAPAARARTALLVGAGRTLLVGGVLGLETVIIVEAGDDKRLFALTMIGYGAAVAVLAWAAASRLPRWDLLDVVRTANVVAAPLTLALLYGVSESTQATVTATGVVHSYPWLPLWLAAALTAGVSGWLVRGLVRAATPGLRDAWERRAIVLVVGPVGLFLLVAFLPGDLGTIHLFEEGQILAGAEITRDGAFPWRDLLVVHGLLHDVWTGLFGSGVIEDSRWGVFAGQQLLIVPLSWVALYYLCAYLFWTNWLFLLGSQLLVVTGQIFAIHYRLGLIPIVLLLLAALLHRATVVRAVAFTTVLFVQAIVTPEALWSVPANLGVILLFELYYREKRRGLAKNLRRTWLCVASASLLVLGWSVFLLGYGALGDFVFSYRAFIPGHQLTGGVPRGTYGAVLGRTNIGEHYEDFAVLAPVFAILVAMLFFVVRTRTRRPLAVSDWVMLAAVAFVLPYYAKFLSRTDHVYHSFAMAVPPVLYVVYRAVTYAETRLASVTRTRGASWFPARHTITLPLLLVLLVSAPVALEDAVRSVSYRFAPDVAEEPELALVGYAREGKNDIRMFEEVGRALDSLLEPRDAVFDFSNTPGLFHYLLGRPASNRYYHVSIAIRQRTQTDLIRLLDQDRPKAVVFTSSGIGGSASVWDKLSSQVRHYDVSEYLLDHYVPVIESHGFVLLRRREDGVRAQRKLYFRVPPCDWGYVPNFFGPAPASDAQALAVPYRKLDRVLRIRGWAVDPEAVRPAEEVVVTRGGRVIARTTPAQARPDISFELSEPAYRNSGFGIVVPVRQDSDVDLGKIRAHAIMRSGEARELSLSPGVAGEQTDALNLVDSRVAPAAEPRGAIDAADISEPLALTLPADASTYRWLEVLTGEPLGKGSFELSDRLDEAPLGTRMISFKTLDRGNTEARVRVGACSQWRGFGTGAVYFTPSPAQDIRGIRLLR